MATFGKCLVVVVVEGLDGSFASGLVLQLAQGQDASWLLQLGRWSTMRCNFAAHAYPDKGKRQDHGGELEGLGIAHSHCRSQSTPRLLFHPSPPRQQLPFPIPWILNSGLIGAHCLRQTALGAVCRDTTHNEFHERLNKALLAPIYNFFQGSLYLKLH